MRHVWWIVISSSLVVFAICAFAVPAGRWLFDWADSGPPVIESIYTAVGALFSGLAFLGVIAAVLFQQQELRLQRADQLRSEDAEKVSAKLDRNRMLLTARINATNAALAVISAKHSLHAGSGRAAFHAQQLEVESAPLLKKLVELEAEVAAQPEDPPTPKS